MTKGIEFVASPEFQNDVADNTLKWDQEWLRYFYIYDYAKWYFYNMRTDNYALSISPVRLQTMTRQEFYLAKPFKEYSLAVWTRGEDIVGKVVVELGCGPALFGKVISRVVNRYIGIDYSKFALQIATITISPRSNSYVICAELLTPA